MAVIHRDGTRHVLPRWRSFLASGSANDLDALFVPPGETAPDMDALSGRLDDWRRERSVGTATDLLGAAVTVGTLEAAESARQFLASLGETTAPFVRELAQIGRGGGATAEGGTDGVVGMEGAKIHRLRARLREFPLDAIAWTELARLHLATGQVEKAKMCMSGALQLGSQSRFVTRAAVRLWTHLREPDRARRILAHGGRTDEDPWLTAAEIASATMMKKSSRYIRVGRRMIEDAKYAWRSRSELAAAIGTVDLGSGNRRGAKKLFTKALIEPTENSVAQAIWAARPEVGGLDGDVVRDWVGADGAFEARARQLYYVGEWSRMLVECWQWHATEPFSTRPAMWGSYVATIALDNGEEGRRFAEAGLRANPGDFSLLNNLAFFHICDGDIGEGRRFVRLCEARLDGRHTRRAVVAATKGLLAMTEGRVSDGRRLYDEARRIAEEECGRAGKDLADRVLIYRARAEGAMGPRGDRGVVLDALRVVKKMKDPMSPVFLRKIEDAAEKVGLAV